MKDLTSRTDVDLHAEIAKTREAVRAFRFNIAGGKAKNLKESMAHRKDIARMLTEVNARKHKAAAK